VVSTLLNKGKVTERTNNAAVAMQDMADATSEAASVAAQYGIDIDELSALIAVAVSKTRESGSEVGNALKSIFINLQDTTSKPIQDAFASVDISMTKLVNGSEKLKTPIELIKELSKAFTSLEEGDTRRANILSDIGGRFYHNVQKCA
jgi:TP901 family phage tail tape measure protein